MSTERHKTVYPLPGEVTAQVDSLDAILDYVGEHSPLQEDLETWFCDHFDEMESEESAGRRIGFLKTADILRQEGNQIRLGTAGYEYDNEPMPRVLYRIFTERFIGFDDIIEILETGPRTAEELHRYLISSYDVDWSEEQTHQTIRRLNYLRSMGLVEQEDDNIYSLTEEGEAVVSDEPPPYEEPLPTPDELVTIGDELSRPCYLLQLSPTTFNPDSISIPTEPAHINPREIEPEALLFVYIDGVLHGYGTPQDVGTTITDSSGNQQYQLPIEFQHFPETLSVSEVLGELVSAELRDGADDTYPFTESGLITQTIGRLPVQAVQEILLNSGAVNTYRDLSLEYDLTPVDFPSADDLELHFPNGELASILTELQEALLNGNHVILVGPPGTGKSHLAREVARDVVGDDNYAMATATADWSTFDTIGGYQPDQAATLQFVPGVFLRRFQNDAQQPTNQWLIIDELNRANIDNAFGALFSALAGDRVTTSYKTDQGEEIVVLGDEAAAREPVQPSKFYIPNTWRMMATMNTHDKMSLYDMSYAFMRRFAFVYIGAPEPDAIDSDLIEEYLQVWEIPYNEDNDVTTLLAKYWRAIQDHRTIGPAIIDRIVGMVDLEQDDPPDLTGATKMFVVSQLEDLPERTQQQAINSLLEDDRDLPINQKQLARFASDYFDIDYNQFDVTE